MHNVVWCCAEILPWKPTTKRRSFNWPHGEEWRRVQGLLEPVDECSDTKVIQRLNVQYINKYERINTRSGRPPSRACTLVRSIRMKFLYIPQARRKIWRTTKRTSLRKVLQQRNTYQIHSSYTNPLMNIWSAHFENKRSSTTRCPARVLEPAYIQRQYPSRSTSSLLQKCSTYFLLWFFS